MKKIIAILMAALLMLSLVACGTNPQDTDATQDTGATESASTIESALEILNTVWASYADEEKFFAAGGDMTEENMNPEGPGVYGVEDAEAIDASLAFPAASISKIDSAASLMHMMNQNNFTCGVYHLVNKDDASALADEIKANISSRQWLCGSPEKYVIATVEDYVIAYFGSNDLMGTFTAKLTAAYPDTQIIVEETIA